MPGPLDNLDEAIRELQDLYDDPEIVTTADKIQQPDPREDVKTIDAINAFMQRNPKADGGTIGGGNIKGQQVGNRTGFAGPQLIKTGEDKGKYKVRFRDEKFGKRKGAKGYKEGNEIFDTLEEAEKFSKERKDPSKKATGLISKKTEHANKVNEAVNNFIDNNIDRYSVEDFDRFKKDLNQYVRTLKIKDLPGNTRNTFYKGFPNIGNIKSEASFQKFNLDPMSTETMGGVREPYFRKLFYKSKLETDLDLKKRMKDYFDYIIINKNTDRAASKRYKNVLQNMSDIQHVLSDQSGIRGKAMSDVLRKTFGNYDDYLNKTNISSERYAKNVAAIENALSESDLKEVLNGETSIKRFMEKEGNKLKSIFDVSELDDGLRYSMDHTELMSRIANMKDPADIKRALGNLIGMTRARNYELGFGGYASMMKNLTNKIDKGFDPEGNLKKLNKITKKAYPELKNKKAYEIIDGKLTPTKFFNFQTTAEDRFRQYFTQLDKTEKGSAVIKKQYGNLENLLKNIGTQDQIRLARIGCPGKATGGRVGYFQGENLTACAIRGADKLKNDPINLTPGDQQNLRALGKSAKAVRFLKNVLGPGALVGELVFEGGSAVNKFMDKGIPFKQALGESYINKYLLGPKTQIDVEAERAKEMAKGEEFAMAERGRRMAPFMPQSAQADEQRVRERMKEMKALYPQYSDQDIINFLEIGGYDPKDVIGKTTTTRITPAVTTTLTGIEQLKTAIQEQQALDRIAEAGGVANLAKGGRAGFKLGSVRKGVLSLIDKSLKKTPKDTTTELDKLIKKTLDEDFFDKKDRILDSINISEAKKRKNYPYSMRVFEEPKNLDFYRDIKESNFRTKTGPFFDRRKRAGGGILKEAGDLSGPPPEKGPNSQGLQGLLNRVKKPKE